MAQREGQYELASRLRYATIPELEGQLPSDSESEALEESPMVMLHDRVTSNDISRVVARATGIPVQNLLKGERDKLVHVRFFIKKIFDLCVLLTLIIVPFPFFTRWKMLFVNV